VKSIIGGDTRKRPSGRSVNELGVQTFPLILLGKQVAQVAQVAQVVQVAQVAQE
jgi:hypothetical protein